MGRGAFVFWLAFNSGLLCAMARLVTLGDLVNSATLASMEVSGTLARFMVVGVSTALARYGGSVSFTILARLAILGFFHTLARCTLWASICDGSLRCGG